jgi:isocitrate/isopropylmalate dehydrogenase
MVGTIAGSESLILSFDDDLNTRAVIAEATHGTAPSLQGKNLANPIAMILAGAALLSYIDNEQLRRVHRAIREATLETVYDGVRTADLGGQATTSEFTDEVIRRVRAKLAVWDALG